jgi:hypothetical protein
MKSLRLTSAVATIVLVLVASQIAVADTVNGTVKYLAATSIYLNVGRLQGLQQGDSGQVMHEGKAVARITVAFVADSSSSCTLVEKIGDIHVGDVATVYARGVPAVAPIDTTVIGTPVPPVVAPQPIPPLPTGKRVTRLTGRIGLQMYGQKSRDAFDYSFNQPGVSVRARLENLFGTAYAINVRLLARKDIRAQALTVSSGSQWYNRIYEAALVNENPESDFHYGIGRLTSNSLAGIGYVDGAMAEYRMGENVKTGVFGGTQPNYRTSDFSRQTKTGGAYATYQQGDYSSRLYMATLALAGEYHGTTTSREFVYQQFNTILNQAWNFYESAEVNVNRGWLKKAEGKSLTLSNLLANIRWSPNRVFSATFGYDNRTPFHTYDTRSIPDSLFDNAIRQGFRLSLDGNLPGGLRAGVNSSLLTQRSAPKSSRALGANLSAANILKSQVFAMAQFNTYTNAFSSGYQPSLRLSRNLAPTLNVGVQGGGDRFTLSTGGVNQTYSDRWVNVNADWNMSRRLYSTAYYEIYRGKPFQGDHYFLEIGWRF